MASVDVLVALFFAGGEFLHDGLFTDDDAFVLLALVDLLHDGLLLVCESVDNHFEIFVVLIVFFLDVLDRLLYPEYFIVLLADVDEFAIYPLSKLFLLEQELTVIQGLIVLHFRVVQLMLILLTQSQLLIFLQIDLAFTLELFEVLI